MLNRKHILKAFIICMVLSVLACANFTRNTYRTLAAAGESYDIAMSTAGSLYLKGLINEEQKNKVIDIATKYKLAYNVAVDALAMYEKTSDPNDKEKLAAAMSQMAPLLEDLIKIVNEFSKK